MPTLQVNDVRLYYELHGPQEADPLVLSNGILMSTASWAWQVLTLSTRYRLILYDCRGQWQSDHPPGPYTMEQHADDLAGLLDGLGIERAHIGGISYGGEISLMFALRHPQRAKSLVVADAASHVEPQLRIVVESWVDAARTGEAQTFFNSTVPWNFSAQFIRGHQDLLAQALSRYATLDYGAVIGLCECFLAFGVTQRLGEIRLPTCVIVGEQDILKGQQYAEIISGGITGAELHVVPQSGHATCWEQPEVFNSIVLGFLGRQG